MLNKHLLCHAETVGNQGSLYTLLVDTFSVTLAITFNRLFVKKNQLLSMLKSLEY